MTTLLLALLANAQAAPAPACDAKTLERDVAGASPSAMADAFLKLAECDPAKGKKIAATHMRRMIADPTSIPAVIKAIEIGADADILAWIGDESADVRSRLVGKVGSACKDRPELLTNFFVKARASLGDQFLEERWHRGLDDCRTDGVRTLLTTILEEQKGRGTRNNSQFFSVLEVWARNLGADALPALKTWLSEAKGDEEATFLVNAFADAARVGSVEGMDAETAKQAAAVLVELAPNLPYRAVVRTRDTLVSMQQPELADGVAKFAWRDRYVDGAYTYGVALVEDATCKNGKRQGMLHLGTFTEAGTHWPDQLTPELEARLTTAWSPSVATKCKGTGTVTVAFTGEPVTPETLATWQQDQTKAFVESLKGAHKTSDTVHDAFAW